MNEFILEDVRQSIESYFIFEDGKTIHPFVGSTNVSPDNTPYVTFVNGAITQEGFKYTAFCTSEEHFKNGVNSWLDTQEGKVLYWRKFPSLVLNDSGKYKIVARLCVGNKVNEVIE